MCVCGDCCYCCVAAGPGYRPPVSSGQPPVYSQGLQPGHQPPGQQHLQRAQSPMPRPTIVQQAGYPTTNLYQVAPASPCVPTKRHAPRPKVSVCI